jgi:hypothetical protein
MTTRLDKELKRSIDIDGLAYTVIIGPEGLRLTEKGRRKARVELAWKDLVSGEAALAVAFAPRSSEASVDAVRAPGERLPCQLTE